MQSLLNQRFAILLFLLASLGALGAAKKVAPRHIAPIHRAAPPAPRLWPEGDLFPLPMLVTKPAPKPIPTPGIQSERWRNARVNKKDLIRADGEVAFYLRNRTIYEKLQGLRENGVPAPLIFGFHMRESDHSFSRHLHEGSLLTHRTVDEPKGRPLHPEPPYTFLVSAEDALYTYEHLERHDWKHLEPALQWAISYNGMGYDHKGLPSPYMWAGTNIYTAGKYVSDGRYDSHAVDKQLGLAAVMIRMKDHGIAMPFE